MRYILLSKFQTRNKITRIIIIFLIFTIWNLYEKFHDKKNRIIFILNKIFNFSIKQHATR